MEVSTLSLRAMETFRYDLSDKTTLAFGTRYTHTSLSASWNETA